MKARRSARRHHFRRCAPIRLFGDGMYMPRRLLALAVSVAFICAGCSGGKGNTSLPGIGSNPVVNSAPSGSGRLALTIGIPVSTASAHARRPQYVSSATKSVAISVGGAPDVNVDLTAASGSCTQNFAKPALVEYPVGSQPRGIINGPDGALWFAEFNSQAVGKLTTGGVYSDHLTTPWFTDDIIVSPGGTLWASIDGSVQTSNSVEQLTTAGFASNIPLTNQPDNMVVAPDNNVWYTVSPSPQHSPTPAGQAIYRMDGSGTLTGTFPSTGKTTRYLANGPDNAIWFTEKNGTIGRLSVATTALTEFPVTAGTQPLVIAAGPDGAIWFTDDHTMMNRMTTSGVVTNRFALPAGSVPLRIINGPDGALWFADSGTNSIGRITTGGVVSEFPTPSSGSMPAGITTGSDGNMWFTEQGASNVGQVQFPLSCTASGFSVPAGSATIKVRGYDAIGGSSGTGHLLETNTVPVTIVANAVNNVSVALDGVVSSVQIQYLTGTGFFPICNSGTIPMQLVARDASGSVIIGAGLFRDALGNALTFAFTDSDANNPHQTSVDSTPMTGPADTTRTFTYNYPPNIGNFTFINIGVSVSGGTIANTASLTPSPFGAQCE
jgi:virginiamycin B lyase